MKRLHICGRASRPLHIAKSRLKCLGVVVVVIILSISVGGFPAQW